MLIQPYDPKWPENFQDIKQIIQEVLTDQIISIEHIGSTAVSGLAAKPIIDLDIVYQSEINFEIIKKGLGRLNYAHNGDQGIPGREAFKRTDGNPEHPILDKIKHHLYACPLNSEELKRHILFRDYLIGNSRARTAYQSLKLEIAKEANQDRKEYARIKELKAKSFVQSIIDLAHGLKPSNEKF